MPKKIGKRGCVIRMLLVILIGLLDLTPLGARTASAQTSPAPILSAVSPSRIALGGLIELIIEDLNAKVVQDKYDPNELHLSLNDYVLQGLKPDSYRPDDEQGSLPAHPHRRRQDGVDRPAGRAAYRRTARSHGRPHFGSDTSGQHRAEAPDDGYS